LGELHPQLLSLHFFVCELRLQMRGGATEMFQFLPHIRGLGLLLPDLIFGIVQLRPQLDCTGCRNFFFRQLTPCGGAL